ncbi:hypothetical protein [Ruegeria sp. HKCCD7221]|uniref:hypothetical protein n=1 Tax=Ruegeria sp. HKCCD7221 TaxID=2683009 RepID=UPI00148904A8|nr:hypothetical protein [Ruegeria sp. HKCCD7221]
MTDETRRSRQVSFGGPDHVTNSGATLALGFQVVTSMDILADLSNWQVAQGYEMPNSEFDKLAKRRLSSYFWEYLSELSDYRFSQRPLRRRDDLSFEMLLTDLERTQIAGALKRDLRIALDRFFRKRRDEWLKSGEFPRRVIADGIKRAVDEKWCIKMHCTTCASYRFRLLFLGEPDSRRVVRPQTQLTIERAKEVVGELAKLSEFDGKTKQLHEPVMVMLYWIWCEFGDRAHLEVFTMLQDTWAGEVLDHMKEHYDHQETRRARHRIRQREANR